MLNTRTARVHEKVLPKSSSAIPWGDLDRLYHSLWNMSKPILLEASPPEKDHSDALFKQFSRHGQVSCSYTRPVLRHSCVVPNELDMCARGSGICGGDGDAPATFATGVCAPGPLCLAGAWPVHHRDQQTGNEVAGRG